ncbi:SIMPL domain-containing protein [Xylanibacillus composti]|uniref:SIMPL domain-containing protein n=1 Tax=Xylanibacillus composti TaxID=1572762 RepID=A0A8J4M2X6_9BACL|nr:SIMPL domain-containing protein [Xylanibacillus composti]GIQ68991.1 SIMPL domain-containing protein [Xylanibacillus composti]
MKSRPAAAADGGVGTERTITVTGQGSMEIAPDIAYVQLGIQTRAATAQAAQSENAEAFQELEKVLFETYKLDPKDVQTTGFHVNPEFDYSDKQGPKVTGYAVTHAIQVSYRDLETIGPLLDAASRAGVNQINGIRFGTEKSEQYEIDVLAKAMANARAKAEAIAKTENRTVQQVLHVSQGQVSMPDNGLFPARKMVELTTEQAVSTPISAGQLTISTTVTVQYSF